MYSQLKKNQQQMYHHTQITPNAKTNNTYAKFKTVNQSSFGTLFLSNVLHILISTIFAYPIGKHIPYIVLQNQTDPPMVGGMHKEETFRTLICFICITV